MVEHLTLSVEVLNQLLKYNPTTGDLIWKPRPIEFFKTGSEFKRWNARYKETVAGSLHKHGYLQVKILGRMYKAHRIAWALYYGEWPEGQIDHEDRSRANNRIKNLRVVSNQENQKNVSMKKNNKSGHTGVRWSPRLQKWYADIGVDYKTIHLGVFTELEDAIAARKAAEIEYNFHPNHGAPHGGIQ